ncbi:MAG: DNA-processing protein DprA [Planctomycetales bacterium]|nr:DNA-processing protein DprA [Planctomycetales bacterium]
MSLAAAEVDYLQVVLTTGVGPCLLARLLQRFQTATALLAASPQELVDVEGVGVALARRLRSNEFRQAALRVVAECEQLGIRIVLPDDGEFPRLLREIPDPPSVLYVRGALQPSDALAVAIVGTRGASQYGRSQAERFARSLALAGMTIVSGLARGIDAAAHRGALEAGGRTIAVLSSGLADIYPPQHQQLAEDIAAQGALLSEMPPGTKPKKGMFPHRNRLISGLTLGTLVIEAGERSGALITARLAGEQGREVFALPGLVTSPRAAGCHQLIRDGGQLLRGPEDVLEALGPLVEGIALSPAQTVRHAGELQLNEQETCVLQAIAVEPTDINAVVVASGLPVPRVLSTLSVLEMRRLVRRLSGQLVQRV